MKALLLFVGITVAYAQLNFLTLGDWGSPGTKQRAVAAQMGAVGAQNNIQFVLALGDNFYEDGVSSDTDPQWQTTYSQVYTADSLNVPWYAILGNHDHHKGRGQGELNFYKNHRDSRWTEPDYWYTQTFQFNATNVQIVFIDTVLMDPSSDVIAAWNAAGTYASNSALYASLAEDQLAWLTGTLANSTADWLLVAGHYPIYSGGEHGNNEKLLEVLNPLLEQYHVDAYFNGHDHSLQHLQGTTVNYYVSGSGAKTGSYTPIDQSVFGTTSSGFMLFSLYSWELNVSFIDRNGQLLYNYTQPRQRNMYAFSL
jgi:hypothetical protein